MKLVPITLDSPREDEAPFQISVVKKILESVRQMYSATAYTPPWIPYLAVRDGKCVGTCAFKRPPENNQVEIAYFTFAQFMNQGNGTRMAEALIEISKNASPEVEIIAQTLPKTSASTKILEKLNFTKIREFEHPEDGLVWEWKLET